MGRLKNAKFNSEEEEGREDPVTKRECSDEEEANEDLSLKILEKALSRRDSSSLMLNGSKRTNLEEEDAHHISIVPKEEHIVEKDAPKGQENDDDDEVAEPKHDGGGTSSNMVLKKLLRGARYFDPPDDAAGCYSCGEQGHVTINCPTPTTRKKPCFICGSLEHGAKQCTKGHDCYICKKSGHRAKDCPDKYKSRSKSALCLRCGHSGHDMILCKIYNAVLNLVTHSPSWSASCCRCGQHWIGMW